MKRAVLGVAVLCMAAVQVSAGDDGWATGAGVLGMVVTPIAAGLGIGAAVTNGDGTVPTVPLGASCYALLAASVPIVSGGGSSARHGSANGVPALRIISWISYGLVMADGAAMLALGIADVYVPTGLIITQVGLGVASGFMMAADALASGAQARSAWLTPDAPPVALCVRPLHGGAAASLRFAF